MDINTEVNLAALHATIVAQIEAQFPDLQTVEFYRTDRDKITTPACILDITEFEVAPEEMDAHDGTMPLIAHFEAELIFGFRVQDVKLQLRLFAAAFAAWLKNKRWPGHITGPAMVVGCYRDEFEPKLDQYEVWRVEWKQLLHIGDSHWFAGPDFQPTEVYLGITPNIGPDHRDDYVKIAPTNE